MREHQFEYKTWTELNNYSKQWKNELRTLLTQNFTKIGLMRPQPDRLSLFAITNAPGGSTQTLYTVKIPLELTAKATENSATLELPLRTAFRTDPFNRYSTPSPEFSLLCERQRAQVVTGVSDYEMKNGQIVLLAGDQIFRYDPINEIVHAIRVGEPVRQPSEPMDVSEGKGGAKGCSAEHTPSPAAATAPLSTDSKDPPPVEFTGNFVSSAKICPSDSSFLAYVLNKQVYVERDGRIIYRTSSNSKHITNGVPSYIVQEELERFEGIWWSESRRRLLYEHVNEEGVESAQFGVNGERPTQPMKYPQVGSPNAISTLRMIVIEGDTVWDVPVKEDVIFDNAPYFEYIVRAGFFSDGETVWVQVMSRNQSECSLLLIPMSDFDLPPELGGRAPPVVQDGIQLSTDLNMGTWNENSHEETMEKPPRGKLCETVVIHRARSDYWINSHNAIYPLKIEDEEQPLYEFIYCLEQPNGSCLALISAELDQTGYCRHTEERLLMAPNTSINKTIGIVVDESRQLVFYVANESHPCEWNICVSHYRSGAYSILTEAGISYKAERAHPKLALDVDHGFVCWMNSCGSPPQCRFYSFRWTDGQPLPTAVFCANVVISGLPAPKRPNIDVPEMIEYTSRKTGLVHYGMVIRPDDFDPCRKYPVFHYVYGGPGIQIVHNDFSWVQWKRFAALGYVVVMIDNRGTANRGIEFERHIHRRMGTVEVEDQVEGLQMIAEKAPFMDMNRVIVHGWSYGGYMALLLLAHHPKIYRAAMAGGAVSDWRLYDTAYTERYLGFPVIDHVYHAASVMRHVDKLPDEPNRLFLIHGLLDENVHFAHTTKLIEKLNTQHKPYELLVFPHERHGIRTNDNSIVLDTRMMYFAQRAVMEAPPAEPVSNSVSSMTDAL
ncbi:unnamed protein product [Caenorhabditis sp. 36 PRJEB53466]|nr:unnamed protein product [Caenorhabditis sp. 36 PRJEB53466]